MKKAVRIMGMKKVLKQSKKNFPNCRHFKTCGRKATSLRATLCESCFKARAALNGAQSGGNTKNHVVDGSLSLSLSLSPFPESGHLPRAGSRRSSSRIYKPYELSLFKL